MADAIIALTANLAMKGRGRIEFKPEWFDADKKSAAERGAQLNLQRTARRSILIVGEVVMEPSDLQASRKAVLVVLFVPSVERDGATPIDQGHWVEEALDTLGRLFGGATAFPRARGVWRDDERGGVLIKDEPVVIHCYTTPTDVADSARLAQLGSFCRRMGREARQGEVGLVIGDEYLAFRDFSEE